MLPDGDALRISGGERHAKVYNIDYSRCISCGYCVAAGPTDAITHGHGFEIASYNTSALILPQGKDARADPGRRAFPLKAEPRMNTDICVYLCSSVACKRCLRSASERPEFFRMSSRVASLRR